MFNYDTNYWWNRRDIPVDLFPYQDAFPASHSVSDPSTHANHSLPRDSFNISNSNPQNFSAVVPQNSNRSAYTSYPFDSLTPSSQTVVSPYNPNNPMPHPSVLTAPQQPYQQPMPVQVMDGTPPQIAPVAMSGKKRKREEANPSSTSQNKDYLFSEIQFVDHRPKKEQKRSANLLEMETAVKKITEVVQTLGMEAKEVQAREFDLDHLKNLDLDELEKTLHRAKMLRSRLEKKGKEQQEAALISAYPSYSFDPLTVSSQTLISHYTPMHHSSVSMAPQQPYQQPISIQVMHEVPLDIAPVAISGEKRKREEVNPSFASQNEGQVLDETQSVDDHPKKKGKRLTHSQQMAKQVKKITEVVQTLQTLGMEAEEIQAKELDLDHLKNLDLYELKTTLDYARHRKYSLQKQVKKKRDAALADKGKIEMKNSINTSRTTIRKLELHIIELIGYCNGIIISNQHANIEARFPSAHLQFIDQIAQDLLSDKPIITQIKTDRSDVNANYVNELKSEISKLTNTYQTLKKIYSNLSQLII